MAVSDISIPMKYIENGKLSQRSTSGKFIGQIYYATDLDLSYVWDGIEWQETSVDLTNVNKLIGLNALNILDLTAQSSLTAGINANFERDIYTDSDGYLDTIDAGNTTATFNTNKYKNKGENNFSVSPANKFSDDTNYRLLKTYTTEVNGKFIFKIINDNRDVNSERTKYHKFIITYTDATTEESVLSGTTGQTFTHLFTDNKEVDYIEYWAASSSSDGSIGCNSISIYEYTFNDEVLQTNAQTIDAGFTKFMIVSNEETTGTGSVSYDITFNSDAENPTYQEDLESFKEYSIEEAGTSLILKQNLNAGASNGLASAYNWGVLLW